MNTFLRIACPRALLLGVLTTAGLARAAPGDTELITASPLSGQATGADLNFFSAQHSISAFGRFVVFESHADGLVPGGTAGSNIFVHDRDTGLFEEVSVDSSEAPA